MNFMDRFKNGWRLFVVSFGVMRRSKSLLLFPVATAALTVVMAGLMLTPIALRPTGHSYTEAAHWEAVGSGLFTVSAPTEYDKARGHAEHLAPTPAALGFFFLFYFVSMFLATYFNVGFVHEIFNALDGKPVSVGDGLRFAGTKLRTILLWSLFAGLVGVLIKAMEEKFGLLGQWIVRAIGLAWSVASVFVIPVIVMEDHPENPVEIVRQSAGVIKKTWGEALAGYAGLQFGGLLVMGLTLVLVPLSIYAGVALDRMGLLFAGLAAWLLAVSAFSYVMSVAGQIYLCVLYRYAASGVVPDGYTPELLALAWRPKKA